MTKPTPSNLPYFSILTASLNRRSTILGTLDSISRQTYRSLEHIVIDGGSTDNTIEILKKYEERYSLHWISEPDEGIADALNKGLRMATGNYIIVLHADDSLIDSNILSEVYSVIHNYDFDICSFPVIISDSKHRQILRRPIQCLWYNRFRLIFPHQGCFVKRNVFDKIGSFNPSLTISMDYDFFYRALNNNFLIKFFNFPVSLMGGNGISSNSDCIPIRLREDQRIQEINEKNILWRAVQKLFWKLYLPYKKLTVRRSIIR